MAENESKPAAPDPAAAEPKAAAPRKARAGDAVSVVLSDGTHADAEVLAAHKDGTLDVQFEHRGSVVTITKAPFDETGTKPDSWNFR